jgi:hypothetical protein
VVCEDNNTKTVNMQWLLNSKTDALQQYRFGDEPTTWQQVAFLV